jgi:hypothetical protein
LEISRAEYEDLFGPIQDSLGYQRALERVAGGFLRESGIEEVYAREYLKGASHEDAMRAAQALYQRGRLERGIGPMGPENRAAVDYYTAQSALEQEVARRQGPAVPPPRPSVVRLLREVAREAGPPVPPPPPEPLRFQPNEAEVRMAGEVFMPMANLDAYKEKPKGVSGGYGPPMGPPPGGGPFVDQLPSGRPRTGATMAGPRLPGILGVGLASLGGIIGAVMQNEEAVTSEAVASAGLGLGGATLLTLAATRSPVDYLTPRRVR